MLIKLCNLDRQNYTWVRITSKPVNIELALSPTKIGRSSRSQCLSGAIRIINFPVLARVYSIIRASTRLSVDK